MRADRILIGSVVSAPPLYEIPDNPIIKFYRLDFFARDQQFQFVVASPADSDCFASSKKSFRLNMVASQFLISFAFWASSGHRKPPFPMKSPHSTSYAKSLFFTSLSC